MWPFSSICASADIYDAISAKYLQSYVNEYTFRYNARKMTDPERFAHALRNVDGRLTWYRA